MPEHFVVVGAGTMGAGIAYVAGLAGYRVTVCEVDSERATAALDSIRGWAQTAEERGKSEPGTAARVQADISTVSDISLAPRDASVFVEAVPEQPDLKRRVLDAAQERSPQLLASNTSSISITELASGLDAPDRFVGLHFFNPVYAMPLLESLWENTLRITPATRRSPSPTGSGNSRSLFATPPGSQPPGSATRWGSKRSAWSSRESPTPPTSTRPCRWGYRHPMGPLELTDVVGLDVRLAIARTLQEAYGDRFSPPQLLVDMVEQGKLGKKTGEGFYRWQGGQKAT